MVEGAAGGLKWTVSFVFLLSCCCEHLWTYAPIFQWCSTGCVACMASMYSRIKVASNVSTLGCRPNLGSIKSRFGLG